MECTITEENGIKWLNLTGRIDGMTSGEVRLQINDLIHEGQRTIGVDLQGINYISSAGLRIFLEAHKKLQGVDGQIYLWGLSEGVQKVFEMSGFLPLFKITSSREEVILEQGTSANDIGSINLNGVSFRLIKKEAPLGELRIIGSQDNLYFSKYNKKDVITISADEIRFGLGLAALGDEYNEYKNLFGETLVLNRSLFFYPAVKNPFVDFLTYSQDYGNPPEYRFFNGIGFNGSFHHLLSFENNGNPFEVSKLIDSIMDIVSTNIFGIVLLAESRGFWGMNIRKPPIQGNAPENGKDIFDESNFLEWMNFPVEAGEYNNIIACAGLVIKDMNQVDPELSDYLAKGYNFHIHGGVFSKGPLSKDINLFDKELNRILNELDVSKVQHVLGQSKISSGMAGLIELKG